MIILCNFSRDVDPRVVGKEEQEAEEGTSAWVIFGFPCFTRRRIPVDLPLSEDEFARNGM